MNGLRALSAAGLLAVCFGLVTASPAAASVITVPGNYPTIQAAINAAANGDTIVVSPGTYFENIDFMGKLITVQSAQGPGVTTIDGGGVAPVVNFHNGETSAAVIQGFTLQHGASSASLANRGAGVHIGYATSPTVIGNVITANSGCWSGLGLSVDNGSPTIRDNTITANLQPTTGCYGALGGGILVFGAGSAQIIRNTITNNTSDSGAGIALFAAGTPIIQNNTISGNSGGGQGGGLYIVNQSDATIVQNLITGNSDYQAGGIYVMTPSGTRGPLFVNNTVAGNTATDTEVFLGGFDGQVALYNNIVTASSATQPAVQCDTTYSTTSPLLDHNDVFNSAGPAVQGSCTSMMPNFWNISADPKFVSASDCHLAAGSPSIDAGNNSAPSLPATDLDGNPRISGPAVDQGVYEVQQVPPLMLTMSSLPTTVEGASFSAVVAQFSGGVAPYSASITWGDGQTSAGTIGAGNAVSGTHAYAEEGAYSVAVTVTDSSGASISGSTPATTNDASISLAGTTLITAHHGHSFTAKVATLSDQDPAGTSGDYSGQIAWGDGTSTACPSTACVIAAQTGGGFSVTGTHTYARNNTYTATIQLKDAGGSSTKTTTPIRAT
jgi:parallel beta-helix repeat protein